MIWLESSISPPSCVPLRDGQGVGPRTTWYWWKDTNLKCMRHVIDCYCAVPLRSEIYQTTGMSPVRRRALAHSCVILNNDLSPYSASGHRCEPQSIPSCGARECTLHVRYDEPDELARSMALMWMRLRSEASRNAATPAERLLDDALEILGSRSQIEYQARKQVTSEFSEYAPAAHKRAESPPRLQ